MTAGYSGTPLAKKLGVKDGRKKLAVGAPENYVELLEPLPEATDIVHIFTVQRAELNKALTLIRRKIKPTAVVWVSWPKKSARIPTDTTEDTVREVALSLGFVDINVCAVTDV